MSLLAQLVSNRLTKLEPEVEIGEMVADQLLITQLAIAIKYAEHKQGDT